MGYKVKLNLFEGPFDLLVYLIENARMSIYDIQISQITTSYLECIDDMRRGDVLVAADFMVLAATLVEIKSKMLLPRSAVDATQGDYEDPRTALVQKLLEYKKFKAASEFLTEREARSLDIFEKPAEDLSVYTGEPDELLKLDIQQFMTAFSAFITRKRRVEDIRRNYEKRKRQRITTDARILLIENKLSQYPDRLFPFYELIPDRGSRYDTALSFVSILEMLKQKRIDVRQKSLFGEITVKASPSLHSNGDVSETAREGFADDQ